MGIFRSSFAIAVIALCGCGDNFHPDLATLMVSPQFDLRTTEAGGTATFTVTLTSNPRGEVIVDLTSMNTSEGTVSPSTLTFDRDDYDLPREITLTGVDDDRADGDASYTVRVGSTDIGMVDLDVTNQDNDTAGFAVSPLVGLTTSEAGTPATFNVVLQTQPAADVTIAVTTNDATEASTTTTQLVFTPTTWNQAQPVTVTGIDDFVDDGDQAFTIVLGSATSTDTMYNGVDPNDVAGVNADNDTAGIGVTPTSGLVTSEAGQIDGFDVVLSSEPTADVTIAVATSDPTEGTPTSALLTFTAANWDQPQAVAVSGVDDLIADGDQMYNVVLSPAVSTDGKYSGMNADDVAATNEDNDVAGVTVDPVDGLVVSEFTDTDTFTVVLNTEPTANVTMSLTSSDATEGTVSPSSVTFTPADWNVPQTVTVTGVNDGLVDGNIVFTIVTGATVSTDSAYSGLAVSDVEVTNIDDDIAQVYVKARKRLRTSESGQSSTFRVRLTIAPTASVTCTLSSNDTSEGLVSPLTLVFQTNQFGFQTVTVSGVDDQLTDGDVLYTIVLDACTSADPQYDGDNPRDVTVINRDND